MTASSDVASLRTPDRLDRRFGLVAGGYVAALVSPTLLVPLVERLELRDELLTLGLIAAVAVAITAVVGWRAIRWSSLIVRFSDSRIALLLPLAGVLPIFAYPSSVIVYLDIYVGSLEPETTAYLVRFTGVLLGFVAILLGDALVVMGRNRLATAMVDDGDVEMEWRAGWTLSDRVKTGMVGWAIMIPIIGAVLVGSVVIHTDSTVFTLFTGTGGRSALFSVAPLALLLLLVPGTYVNRASSKSTYRMTSAGLERNADRRFEIRSRIFNPSLFVPWSAFEGFTVTDEKIVLHRGRFQPDVRFARHHLYDDEALITALETYLDR